MRKLIKIRKDEESGEHYFDLKDFSDLYDISGIDSYTLQPLEDNIFIEFFDKNGNRIIPKSERNIKIEKIVLMMAREGLNPWNMTQEEFACELLEYLEDTNIGLSL